MQTNIGDYFRHLRVSIRKTQAEVAKAAGFSQAALSGFENGKKALRPDYISRLRKFYAKYFPRDVKTQLSINEKCRKTRIDVRYTAHFMSEKTGISPSKIELWENGEIFLSEEDIAKIVHFLGGKFHASYAEWPENTALPRDAMDFSDLDAAVQSIPESTTDNSELKRENLPLAGFEPKTCQTTSFPQSAPQTAQDCARIEASPSTASKGERGNSKSPASDSELGGPSDALGCPF